MASPSAAKTRPRPQAARPQGRNSAKGRAPVQRRNSSRPSVLTPIIKGLRTFIYALWIGIAHVIGAIARGIGRSARDLDPAHRRDGLGLLYLCAAIIIASVIWFDVSGFVSGVITSLITGAFGIFDTVAPLALLGVAIQILRHPDAPSQKKGRLTIGWTLLALSVMGTTHIILGNPQPVQGAQAMRDAAGWVGWCVSASLNSAVGTAVTVLILVIVLFFAILIITATPINSIPRKFKVLRDKYKRTKSASEDAVSHPDLDSTSTAHGQLAFDVSVNTRRTLWTRLLRRNRSQAAQDAALAIGELAGDLPFITPVVSALVVGHGSATTSDIEGATNLETMAVDVMTAGDTFVTELVSVPNSIAVAKVSGP